MKKETLAQKDARLEMLRLRTIELHREGDQLRFDLAEAQCKAAKLEKHNDVLMRVLDEVLPGNAREDRFDRCSPA